MTKAPPVFCHYPYCYNNNHRRVPKQLKIDNLRFPYLYISKYFIYIIYMSEPIILGERDWLQNNSTFLLTLFGMVGGCMGSIMVYFLKIKM
jgi:hypothetical protein